MPPIHDDRRDRAELDGTPSTGHASWRLSAAPALRCGVDLVDGERLAVAARRSGTPFVSRLLTPAERDLVGLGAGNSAALAALFGAKESVIKLFAGLPPCAGFHDIVVPQVPRAGGAPVPVRLRGPLQHWARRRHARIWVGFHPISARMSLAWALATGEGAAPPRLAVASPEVRP